MSEEQSGNWYGQDHRSGIDRRLAMDRRRENLGIRNVPFLGSYFNRRSEQDRRIGQDRRQAAASES